jgi:hypothetical protein
MHGAAMSKWAGVSDAKSKTQCIRIGQHRREAGGCDELPADPLLSCSISEKYGNSCVREYCWHGDSFPWSRKHAGGCIATHA